MGLNNHTTGDGKGVIGIAMINNSQLNFTNNYNDVATITLGHDIRSFYYDDNDHRHKTNNPNIRSIINFRNSEGINGSFLIRNKNISVIEANRINFESNATLLVGVFGERITRSTGTGDNSYLSIGNNSTLTIDIDENNLNNIIFGHTYTIVSGFIAMASRDRFSLISKTINYNGEEVDVAIDCNGNNTITAMFIKKKESQSEQITTINPAKIEEGEGEKDNEEEKDKEEENEGNRVTGTNIKHPNKVMW